MQISTQSLKVFFQQSYPSFCTSLVGLLSCYFILEQFSAQFNLDIAFMAGIKWLLILGVTGTTFYTSHVMHRKVINHDYKIGHELQNICFAILFLLLMIILSAVLQYNFDLVRPYAFIALLMIPAIFFYARYSLITTSNGHLFTGHLFFGIIMLTLISGFIPSALILAAQKIYLLLSDDWQFLLGDFQRLIDTIIPFLPYLSVGLSLILLYFVTPHYLKERNLHHESKQRFAHLACLIQIFLLPLYFILLPTTEQKSDYVISFSIISVIILVGVYSIIKRKNNWLRDANLLTKDIISPLSLVAILIFLKLPSITISSIDVFLELMPDIASTSSYFVAWMLPDMITNEDLISYTPLLLAKLLTAFEAGQNYQKFIPFSFSVIHTLLLIVTFSALSRFLPHLFTFAILFIIPINFPELLLIISYASLLFDRHLLKSPALWSIFWYFGGCLFLVLSPLYALFFLIGTIPYFTFTFIQFYSKQPRHTLNMVLFYCFVTTALIFSPNVQNLFHDIVIYVQQFWLFGDNFTRWGNQLLSADGNFWAKLFYHSAFALWIIGFLIGIGLIMIFYNALLDIAKNHYNLGDWVIISCGITTFISAPVALNNLLGFDQSMTLVHLVYIFAMFGVPVILFRNSTLFGKPASHFLCALTLLGMCVYGYVIVPDFFAIWQFNHPFY